MTRPAMVASWLLVALLAGSLTPQVVDAVPALDAAPPADGVRTVAQDLPDRTDDSAQAPNAVKYELILSCPGGPGGQCPVRAVDGQDAMGSPAIAVDPDNVRNMIIASLHGGSAGAPEDRSRSGQAFTTFTTQNHGASWRDNPFTPPDRFGREAVGEHPSITLDPYGHVYIGSLYSMPVGEDENGRPTAPWQYVIAAQKFTSLSDVNSNQNGEYNIEYIPSLYPGNRIGETWFLHNPITDNMTIVWNEQVTASTGNTSAQSAIGVAWTTPAVADPYKLQPIEWAISPCSTSTNPVLSEGWLYIGCKVGQGNVTPAWDPTAKPGDVAMFRMDPDGGEPQYIGLAPVSGGAPKLGVRSDGRMAIMTTDLQGEPANIRLDGAYGQYDAKSGLVEWGDVHRYGNQLQILFANTPYVASNIQDMIYREYSGVIHMVLKRVVDWPDDDPLLADRPSYYKAIVAIDEHYGLLAEMDLGIGKMSDRLQDATLLALPEATFNDTSDDFLELPPGPFSFNGRPLGDSYQREFYAVGNYGTVDFAEVIEITELRGPAFPALPNPPPPPTPAPASASALALGLTGALTASALTAGTAATMKRKNASGAGRKKRF